MRLPVTHDRSHERLLYVVWGLVFALLALDVAYIVVVASRL